MSDWNHWRRRLIEVRLSVLHGNGMESLRRVQQFSEVDHEQNKSCDTLLLLLESTASEIMKSIKEACDTRISHLCYVSLETATALPTMRDNVGVAEDAGLVIVDSGAIETVGNP